LSSISHPPSYQHFDAPYQQSYLQQQNQPQPFHSTASHLLPVNRQSNSSHTGHGHGHSHSSMFGDASAGTGGDPAFPASIMELASLLHAALPGGQ
jgi:hypothetical protein